MSTLLLWSVLRMVTGSPLIALLLVIAISWWGGRRFFFAPTPVRLWQRWQRASHLERLLANNPHDRTARHELAALLVERRAYKRAADMLRPNLEREQDDETLWLMGVASMGAGDEAFGEKLLAFVAERNPRFRNGAALLELGRWRLKHGHAATALEALSTFVTTSPGSIEGQTLLGLAHRAAGDDARAAAAFKVAWLNYIAAPRFQRSRERLWAYRANPARGVLAGGLLLGALVLVLALAAS